MLPAIILLVVLIELLLLEVVDMPDKRKCKYWENCLRECIPHKY
jgi:hypothetical protein